MEIKVSFIVPIFNTPIYKIKRCFDSIGEVKNIEFEVIVIDDGSKEDVGVFCKEYCENNKKFKYFYQVNQGVSIARNQGVLFAKGEYVTFVDSDDEIKANVYNKLDYTYDLIVFDALIKSKKRENILSLRDLKANVIQPKYILTKMLSDSSFNALWAKLIRKKFLNECGIEFNSKLRVGEDTDFLISLLECRPSIYYQSEIAYIYWYELNTGENRACRYTKEIIEDSLYLYTKKMKIAEKILNDSIDVKERLKQECIKGLFNNAADLIISKKLDSTCKRMIKNGISNIDTKNKKIWNLSNKVRLFFIKYECWSCIWIYSYLRKMYLNL